MDWIKGITKTLEYIEKHLLEDFKIKDAISKSFIDPFYFQKGFKILSGFSLGEYIRNRRLSLAAEEIKSKKGKIIDIALKYGYDSPDSFTKSFFRFHGVTPSLAKEGAIVKSFAPLKISYSLQGGFLMDYKVEEKNEIKLIGSVKEFSYESAPKAIPAFWQEHFQSGKCQVVCGKYGINIDHNMDGIKFDYMIADDYYGQEVPEGFETITIKPHTWLVFPCKGNMQEKFQKLFTEVFTEFLPNSKEFKIAEGCSVEMYSDPREYKLGVQDDEYYSEIWIPVIRIK